MLTNGFLTQVPVTSIMVDGNPALNRVKWTQSGMNLTVGDDNGRIWVYELGEVRLILLFTSIFSNPQLIN